MSSSILRPPQSALDRLVGSRLDGKYHIERLLGRGGMGAVFRALHLGTDRTVALKVIVPDLADRPGFLARFEREARACGRLRHPNIVDVTDFGYAEVDGRRVAYLVMEYLDGCSLADVLRDDAQLPVGWVIDVLEQACSALEEAHRAGILHRDLKPENIWLEPNRRGGYTVKVLDFGLAKLGAAEAIDDAPLSPPPALPLPSALRGPSVAPVEDDVTLERAVVPASNASHEGATELGMIVGTPAYMSPEQCRGEPLSPRSDVYSLGVVSYRLLSGRLPFTGTSEELLTAHLARTPTPLATLCPKLPRDAAATVMRALAKSPQERPQTAGAFASMFTAGALSTGDFLESALMLYLEHFRPFLSAAIVGLSPMVALGLFAALNALGSVYGHPLVPRSAGPGLVGAVLLLTMAPGVLLVHGAVVPAVMQAVVAPLQPIDVASLGRRFRPRLLVYVRCVAPLLAFFVATAVWQVPAHWLARRLAAIEDSGGAAETATAVVIGLLPNLPLLVMLAFLARTGSARALQLIASVAVMEGLTVRQTIERASRLVASCPGPLRVARLAAMALAASLGLAGVGAFALLAQRLPPLVALGVIAIPASLAFVLLAPLLAVISALTYLRARRALGEPLDKALEEFERAVLPESHWKLAERERVATLIASRR